MVKLNLKGFACLGRYQRFEDCSTLESRASPAAEAKRMNVSSYNCSNCGHHGQIIHADELIQGSSERTSSTSSLSLNNSHSSPVSSEKFILGQSKNSSSVKSVVNDLGLVSLHKKKNEDKNFSNLFSKKLMSFKQEEGISLSSSSSSSYVQSLNKDWSPILEGKDPWFRPGFDRDLTQKHLSNLSSGSFIVRRSKSRRDALALSLKTPSRHLSKVAHFLILILPNEAGFRLKGSKKTFPTLRSLIVHHSVMSEILPCPLVLPSYTQGFGCGSENASESSETEEEEDFSPEENDDVADISNYPDLLLTLRQTLYATQDI